MKIKHSKVYRNKIIEGVSIPGIIRNGAHFFVDLEVYENGRVNCWNFEDFEHFKHDVQREWVAVGIPDKKEISIHGLGSWKLDKGEWEYNKKGFIDYVYSIVQKLNPKLENIYKHSEKKVNGVRIGESGNGKIYKEKKRNPNDPFPEKIDGKKTNLFLKNKKNEYYLIRLDIYDENSIIINRLPEPFEITLIQLQEMISKEDIITEIPIKSKVQIYGLGNFEILELSYCSDISEKLLEVKDTIRVLNGKPSSLEICSSLYEDYIQNPSQELKENLKIAYENIPKHQRRYVGDMDVKDIPVRMIIYGEQEIQNWSHYQLAKNMGQELPTIIIPKLK